VAADFLARNSVSVASWTMLGRATGFVRAVVVAAVLGPTFFANTYQSVNQVPNLAYELLAGNLIVSLLVPPLVRHLDADARDEAARLSGGFLGVVLLAFAGAAALLLVTGPLLLRLLTLGVDDPSIRDAQHEAGMILLLFVAPQLVLYGVAGTGMAVQQASGRYGLATAAYSIENLVIVGVLVVHAVLFGTGTDVETVGLAPLAVLGGGSTLAVALHAGLQTWGAHRVGIPLRPRWGWHDPQVREVMALARSSVAFAGLNALRLFGMLVAAGSVAGGVIAFQVAFGLFNLPVAIGGRPIAWALLPRLTRLAAVNASRRFLQEWSRGVAVSVLLVAPVAVSYVVLADPLAELVARGEMRAGGAGLVAAALAGLAVGIVGETAFIHGTHASYARREARTPLRAMRLRVVLTFLGLGAAMAATRGDTTLLVVGLSVGISDVVAASYLGHWLRAALDATAPVLLPSLARTATATAAMALPMLAVSRGSADLTGGGGAGAAILLGGSAGAAVYIGVLVALRSPELERLRPLIASWRRS
jgi:putative peptidoglycan lipid II flippase